MSLPNVMSVLRSVLYTHNRRVKSGVNISANILENNTLVYAIEQFTSNSLILRDGKNQDKLHFNVAEGILNMAAMLKPEYGNGKIIVGRGTSEDKDGKFTAATLSVTFLDAPPADAKQYFSEPNGQPFSMINPAGIPDDYSVNLKDLAAGKRYCRLTIDKLPSQTMGDLENAVILHLINRVNSNSWSVGIIYNTQPSAKDQGAAWDSIFNRDIYIDLNNYPFGIYLFAFIQYQQNPDGSIKFEIGDPKTDAVVTISEA